ncbi:MAG: PspA-associated protein PspAB [Syntrophobacteraceae bacterium]
MKWLDILLGRTRPVASSVEALFSISTAQISLAATLEINPTGRAGITFKPVETSDFDAAEKELKGLLEITAKETHTESGIVRDRYNYAWVLLQDREFELLVAALHMTSVTLRDHGFEEQLLAAVFEFCDAHGRKIYWIYNYKRGLFYPFVPLLDQKRDNAFELRLRALMEKEMPIEPELERWYPIWDLPLAQVRGA